MSSDSNVGLPSHQDASHFQGLACPFYKTNPLQHADCSLYKTRRINHLKQHIKEKHRRAPSCPRCGHTFQDRASCDDHIRDASCETSATIIEPDGLTEEQADALSRRVPSKRQMSLEQQWFFVFDIVCPACQPRPVSPYSGPVLSEALYAHVHKYAPQIFIASLRQEDQWPSGMDTSFVERLKPVLLRALNITLDQLATSRFRSGCSQEDDKGKTIETSPAAKSPELAAHTSSGPMASMADNRFMAHASQPAPAREHHEPSQSDNSLVVVEAQGDVNFTPYSVVLDGMPDFTTGWSGTQGEESRGYDDCFWKPFTPEAAVDI